MGFTVIIPARMQSTRLPGKPLVDIAGRALIHHVYERCRGSGATRILVATDSDEIARAVRAFGGEACMTRAEHPSGTDRIEEVVTAEALADDEVVVNVQGDEPLLPGRVIDQVAGNLERTGVEMATLCQRIDEGADLFDPNQVKVVCDESGCALYFSRAPIPWHRDHFAAGAPGLPEQVPFRRHLGIYAYRVGFLHRFVRWAPTPLEQIERLEQLRALSHGVRIHVAEALEPVPAGVDTPDDLARVRALLEPR